MDERSGAAGAVGRGHGVGSEGQGWTSWSADADEKPMTMAEQSEIVRADDDDE
jgi:hypothetical protein